MVKRLNASISDEVHKALRIALAEDETDFSSWVREHILHYLAKRKKLPEQKHIATYFAAKGPKGKRRGKEG